MSNQFFGTSFKFPVNIIDGNFQRTKGSEYITDAFKQLFESPFGSSYFEPTYGSNTHKILFETNTDVFESFASEVVLQVIEQIPVIELVDVSYTHEGVSTDITVQVRDKRDNSITRINQSVNRGNL